MILVISICTALLGEGLTWLLVYRTEKYIRLKADIERQTKKLEKKKEAHGESTLVSRTNRHILGILNLDIDIWNLQDRTQKRKMDREEERLKSTNRDLMVIYIYNVNSFDNYPYFFEEVDVGFQIFQSVA